MSHDFEPNTVTNGAPLVTGRPRARMAPHWGVLLAAGIVAFLLGVALAAWPGETVAVLAYLLAFQLIVAGAAQMFLAFATGERAARWAIALAGALSIVVGVLFLFNPLQTLTFIGWAAGICVVAVGAADLFVALLTPGRRHRAWQAVRGILGVAIGLFLMFNPDRSLGALVVIACVWLIAYGFITIIAALVLRSQQRLSRT
jgi:uncharacterized membrane protein HdeD (DUF308 family)